jgi:hypothetical protein
VVDTKSVEERRALHFRTMEDILEDIEGLGEDESAVRSTGNWTPAQNLWHVTYFIDGSIDGLDFTAPWFMRVMAKLFKTKILGNPFKPGFKLPQNMASAIPEESVTWPDAVAGYEQWEQLHCRHAELHFSFIHAKGE